MNKIFQNREATSQPLGSQDLVHPNFEDVELPDQLAVTIIRVDQGDEFRFAAVVGEQVVGVFVDFEELKDALPLLLLLPKQDEVGATSI